MFSFLLENIGPALASAFQTHIERLVSSPEESQQRAAAEVSWGYDRTTVRDLVSSPEESQQRAAAEVSWGK